MILMLVLFSLWFGFYIYINKEVSSGVLSWIAYALQLFVFFRLLMMSKGLGSRQDGLLFIFAVVGLAFLIEFILRKFISRFSGQSSAKE